MAKRLEWSFRRVKSVFKQIDKKVKEVQVASGVRCREACGACCLSPHVEASPIEMLGIVKRLKRLNKLELVFSHMENHPDQKICVFYQPTSQDGTQGRCGVYEDRPSICRLFGFAGRKTKHHHVEIGFCKVHKDDAPTTIEQWEQKVAAGQVPVKMLPLFSVFRLKIQSACPSPKWNELMPINQAFLKAAEYDYFSRDELPNSSDCSTPDRLATEHHDALSTL